MRLMPVPVRAEPPLIEHPVPPALPPPGPGTRGALEMMLGVVLPTAALVVEMATGMSADAYANPLPNWRALLLAWMVPVGNFTGWLGAGITPSRWRAQLAALALLVSAVYGIVYLPLVPFAILAIMAIGIGLLPLSPFGAAFTAIRQLRDVCREPGAPPILRSLGIAAGIIIIAAAPTIWTRILLDRAIRGTPEVRAHAVEWLRWIGDRAELRETARPFRRSWFDRPYDEGAVQKVHYLVTGEALGPAAETATGLSVSSSRLEGRITPRAAAQYQEWTLEFRNATPVQQEAQAVIVLPDGGVVSRVTLWVDGEEREAAFGGRWQARAAYQSVVSTRRDPLLVETAGPGRVLARCFPVPPQGSMKIRLGISAPARDGNVQLPYFASANFPLGEIQHSIWIDGGAQPYSRSLSNAAMAAPLPIAVDEPAAAAWTPDPLDPGRVIVQRISAPAAPDRVTVVVDGSKSMADLAAPIEAAFRRAAKSHRNWKLAVTDDFRGGSDNVAALRQAQNELAAAGGGTILWLHGPQPVEVTSAEVLRAHLERKQSRVRLVTAQMVAGPDVVTPKLDGLAAVEPLRTGPSDWPERLAAIGGVIREVLSAEGNCEGARAPMDVARLWAADEVIRLLGFDPKGAGRLGAALRIVTPASSAVVLENRSQYRTFGLDPDKGVTNVPEPGTLILVGGALGVLWAYRKRKPNVTS